MAARLGTGRPDASSRSLAHTALGLRPLSLPEVVVTGVHVRASVLATIARTCKATIREAAAKLAEGRTIPILPAS